MGGARCPLGGVAPWANHGLHVLLEPEAFPFRLVIIYLYPDQLQVGGHVGSVGEQSGGPMGRLGGWCAGNGAGQRVGGAKIVGGGVWVRSFNTNTVITRHRRWFVVCTMWMGSCGGIE